MKYRFDDTKLEQLSNELLDDAYQPSARDIAAMGGKLSPEGLAEVGGEAAAENLRREEPARNDEYGDYVSKQLGRQLLRGRIVQAIDNADLDGALVPAGSDPKLLQFVARVAAFKRGRGEQKRRPRDYSPTLRMVLQDLWFEINLLRRLWKLHNIKIETDRTMAPKAPKEVARDIVLRRAGAERLKSKMDSFDRNRSRPRR